MQFLNKYFSNQTALFYAREIDKIKEQYEAEFYGTVNYMKTKVPYDFTAKYTASQITDLFEENFFDTVRNAIEEICTENIKNSP